jgi:hypothetical protein
MRLVTRFYTTDIDRQAPVVEGHNTRALDARVRAAASPPGSIATAQFTGVSDADDGSTMLTSRLNAASEVTQSGTSWTQWVRWQGWRGVRAPAADPHVALALQLKLLNLNVNSLGIHALAQHLMQCLQEP